MKIKNLIAAMSAIAFISCAPQPSLAQEVPNRVQLCMEVQKLAWQAMMHRQKVNDLNPIWQATEDSKLAEFIVLKAYRVPLVPEEEHDSIAVEFANQAHQWCMNSSQIKEQKNQAL